MRHFKFVNPNPFHYAEQIDWCTLLGITVFRTTATRFYAYLICLTHVPDMIMAVHLTPFTTAPVLPSSAFS